MQGVDVGWVFADEPGCNIALKRLQRRRNYIVAKALTPTGDALVGLHLYQQMVLARKPQPCKFFDRGTHVVGDADIVSLDCGYFHDFSSLPRQPAANSQLISEISECEKFA